MTDDSQGPDDLGYPDEKSLVQAARNGDGPAISRLFELLRGDLSTFLRRGTGEAVRRHGSLEDLTQEVWMRALGALEHLREDAEVADMRALVFKHARWTILGAAERARAFQGESVGPTNESGGQEQPAASTGPVTREDSMGWLKARIDSLGPEMAKVIHLRLEGLEFDEIAARIGISEAAARKRFERGTKSLTS